jgi:hypothetical protein
MGELITTYEVREHPIVRQVALGECRRREGAGLQREKISDF